MGKEPGPGPSMAWALSVRVSMTIDPAQTWSQMVTTLQQSTVNAPHSNQLNLSCIGVNFGHLSTHNLSFFAQRNNLQQNEASAANADTANQSDATDVVGIISFHRDDQSQMVAGSDKLIYIYRSRYHDKHYKTVELNIKLWLS